MMAESVWVSRRVPSGIGPYRVTKLVCRYCGRWQEVGEHRPECPERKGRRQAALELAEQESVRSHSIIKMLVERE